MKTILFSLLFIFYFVTFDAMSQCDQEALLKSALTELDEGQYIRDFVLEFNSPKDKKPVRSIEYRVLLNGRSQYKFKLMYASSEPGKITMKLFDENKIVGSNVGGGKVYDTFGFICKSTKVYKIVFTCKGKKEECARAVLALQKQFTEKETGF